MSEIAGTATGCVDGQRPRIGYAMWLWWSALSRLLPSQQLGKLMCRRRLVMRVSGHVGTVDDGRMPAAAPQFQNVTRRSCALVACAWPAIILNAGGNARTRTSVRRR